MSGNAMRACLLSGLLAVTLAACGSDKGSKEPDPNTLPVNYKKEVIDTLAKALDDPTNVREAFISEPALRPVGRDQRYAVCVRYNGRNLFREYVGAKERIGYFYAGHLNQLVEATKEQCGNAAYKPFPEMEKLCLGSKCE